MDECRLCLSIRTVEPDDAAAIDELYTAAFPDEELLPLVKALSDEPKPTLCLIAVSGGVPCGHVVFTRGELDGQTQPVALLGPLAVAPEYQRQGIGKALVEDGLRRLRAEGVAQVHVLGDPAYYARLGFKPSRAVTPPYELPEEWQDGWQVQQLGEGPPLTGAIRLPDCWMQRSLWLP